MSLALAGSRRALGRARAGRGVPTGQGRALDRAGGAAYAQTGGKKATSRNSQAHAMPHMLIGALIGALSARAHQPMVVYKLHMLRMLIDT